MSRRRKKARAQISSMLDDGEVVAELADIGVKTPRMSAPAPAWVIVTDRRFLLFRDMRRRRSPVGQRIYEARRDELHVSRKSGLCQQVVVDHAATGKTIVRLRFGACRAQAKAVVEAAATPAAVVTPATAAPSASVIDRRPGERLPDGSVLTASAWLRAVLDADPRYC